MALSGRKSRARTLGEIEDFALLPTASAFPSRPIASFIDGRCIWEIGWNGVWVKRWKCEKPTVA